MTMSIVKVWVSVVKGLELKKDLVHSRVVVIAVVSVWKCLSDV